MTAPFATPVSPAPERQALERSLSLLTTRRSAAAAGTPAFEGMRLRARAAKLEILRKLPEQLERFEAALVKNGAKVHWASDAAEARSIISQILKDAGVAKAVKSKSMVTEEIELNHALEAQGIKAVETDLGEYVAQLRKEKPSHIILPIVHLSKEQVSDTFRKTISYGGDDSVAQLVEAARLAMRREFETADAGITGANFGVADEGAICIVSNEGNARFVTSLPRVHIAVTGIEKLVPSLADLSNFLGILARSATGQALTVYTNLIWPGRNAGDGSGPREWHVVLLDNGRSSLLQGEAAEMLACIRCGACLNVCPIYRQVGGHAYESSYPGPMGAILSPFLDGAHARELPEASTLCGACKDACPVKIDIPRLLLHLRGDRKLGPSRGLFARAVFTIFGALASRPRLYLLLSKFGRVFLPKKGWGMPAKRSFLSQWEAGRRPEP